MMRMKRMVGSSIMGEAAQRVPWRLARAVPQGRVYGVDIESDMVRYLNKRAERENLPNLVSYRGDADDPRLPEPVDVAILVGVYHHIATRVNESNGAPAA